jgi:tetratricopeptide (TPR) repeat protein
MEGLRSKFLKSLNKERIPVIQMGFLLLLSGCASAPPGGLAKGDDAHGKIEGFAQANWVKAGSENGAEYHFILAQAYSQEGKVERAIEEYRAALAYDSHSAVLHSKLGAEYLKKGSMTFAIEECERALEIDPRAIEVRLMLGGIYSLNMDSDRALGEYEKVLKIDPSNDEAAVFKTQVLAEKERYDEALKFIRSFTARVKDSAAAWFYAGKLEQAKEHIREAVVAYRKALEVRPGFSQATLAIGLLLEAHGEGAKAIEAYENQLEEKFDAQVSGRLVTLYLKGNQQEKALSLLKSMAAADPEDLNTQLRMGLLFMQKENWAEAQKTLEALLVKVPDSDKVHYYLSAVFEQQGKMDQTLDHLLKVSVDSKLFEDSNLHAVGILRRQGMKEKALITLKEAVQKSPENPGFYLVMASMFEDEKRLKDASQSLSEGLKIFPDHEKMRYFYGAILEKLGNTDEAVAQMEKILEKSPGNADALNFVAYSWTTQGIRLKDAEEMLKRALKLKPNNPFILDSLGWNQFMLGHHKDALVYLEKAAGLKADEETILEHLVQVYAKNQMPERAQALRVKIEGLQSPVSARAPASVEEK